MVNLPPHNDDSSMRNPANWPKSLQEFISHSFEQAAKQNIQGMEKKKFQGELRNIINKSIKEKKVLINDWTKQTLPTLCHPYGQGLQLYCDIVEKKRAKNLKGKKKSATNNMETTKLGQNSKAVSIPKKRNIFEQDENDPEAISGVEEDGDKENPSKKRHKADIKVSKNVLEKIQEAEADKNREKMKKEDELRRIVARKVEEERVLTAEKQKQKRLAKLERKRMRRAMRKAALKATHEADQKAKQKAIQEAKQKAVQEAKQKAVQEAKQKAIQEAKQKEMQEATQNVNQKQLANQPTNIIMGSAGTSKEKLDVMNSEQRKKLREKRFERELQYEPTTDTQTSDKADPEGRFVGTCEKLEKKYLRLTSQPNPELVRPVRVLKQTLTLLVRKYMEHAHYGYLCDQFKSLRQDLTVQKIWSLFAARVYEVHSKLAIEFGDMGEFNQCQTQLKLLYADSRFQCINKYEFYSYRILYCLLTEDLEEAFNIKLQVLCELPKDAEIPEFLTRAFAALNFSLTSDFYRFSKLAMKVRDETDADEIKVKADSQTDSQIQQIWSDHHLLLGHGKWYFFNKMLENIMHRERIRTLDTICNAYRQIDNSVLGQLLLLDRAHDLADFYTKHSLAGFVENNSSGGILVCHKAKSTVDALFRSTFQTIDIKGQI